MKTKINPRNRFCNWFCLLAMLGVLWSNTKLAPRAQANGGIIVGVVVLSVCGVVVYTLVRVCKRVFPPSTNTNAAWSGLVVCPYVWMDSCPTNEPCSDCETNSLSGSYDYSEFRWITLECSTNLPNWFYVDTVWNTLEDVQFAIYNPPVPAFYRLLLEY